MKSPNNEEEEKVPNGHLFRLPVLSCFQLSCWSKESHGNSPTTQAVTKTVDCSLQINSWVLFLSIAPTQLIEHGELTLGSTWNIHPYVLVSLVWEGTLQATYQKWNVNTISVTKLLTYNMPCLQDMLGQWWYRSCEIINQCLIWLKELSMKWNPYAKLPRWPRIRD